MDPKLKTLLINQHYAIVGRHSAVKTCHWTKEAIRGHDFCYKQQFYGIKSHRCMQMTPVVDRCNHKCVFCWRPMEGTSGAPLTKAEADKPAELVDALIAAQRKLLIGFKGFDAVDPKVMDEALNPNQVAISLAGEPTLYPYLGELIDEFHSRGMTTFLVTNGTRPDVLRDITEPTQLYISVDAPSEKLYKAIDNPHPQSHWKAIQESLSLLKDFKCKTVVRLTLLKRNMVEPADYGKIIEAASPDFVECKAYMWVGASRQRLPREEMPLHSEILSFAGEIEDNTSYKVSDEKPLSRVVLLKK